MFKWKGAALGNWWPGQPGQARSTTREIAYGLLLCWLCAVAQLILSVFGLMLPFGITLLSGFGVIQLVYVVPLVIRFRQQERSNVVKGIMIAASLTFLFNATCDFNLFVRPRF